MAKRQVLAGKTSVILGDIFAQDASKTTGVGLASLVFNTSGLTCYYHRNKDNASVAVSLATMTLGTWSTGGLVQTDNTNQPGLLSFCPPNAALASGSEMVTFYFQGVTNLAPIVLEVELTATDNQDGVRMGMTALPNAAASANGGLPILSNSGTTLAYTVSTVTTVTNQLTAATIANAVWQNTQSAINVIGANLPMTLIVSAIWQDATSADFTQSHSIGKALYIDNVAPGGAAGHSIHGSAGDFTANEKTSLNAATPASVQNLSVVGGGIVTDVGAASSNIGLGATTFGGAGLVATFPIPLNLSITGATNPTAVNGLYVLENFYNGRPGYAGVDGAASYDYWYNGDSYIVSIGAGNDSLTALFIGPTRNLVGQLSPQSPSTGVALVTPCTDATPNAAVIENTQALQATLANQTTQGTTALATSAQASTLLTNVAAIPLAVWNVLQSAIAAGATMGRWLLGISPQVSVVVPTSNGPAGKVSDGSLQFYIGRQSITLTFPGSYTFIGTPKLTLWTPGATPPNGLNDQSLAGFPIAGTGTGTTTATFAGSSLPGTLFTAAGSGNYTLDDDQGGGVVEGVQTGIYDIGDIGPVP